MDVSLLATLSRAVLQQYLDEALAARHQLALGRREVEVGHADKRAKFTEATAPALDAYLAALRQAIRLKDDPTRPAHAPIYLDYAGR
jgi:hypothetical protein